MTRTCFLVDGFNLYHSLRSASAAHGGAGTRWLDLHSLCHSYLSLIGSGAELSEVRYFSALATHREALSAKTVARHLTYIRCLEATGVRVDLGHFKPKGVLCPACRNLFTRFEEKETDVAIAIAVLEAFVLDRADAVVLITGDNDLAPAVRAAKRIFPDRLVCCAFPYDRVSKDLRAQASRHFKISSAHYLRHQFPEIVRLGDGTAVARPVGW